MCLHTYINYIIDCVKPLEDRLGKYNHLRRGGGGARIGRGTGTNSEGGGRLKKQGNTPEPL